MKKIAAVILLFILVWLVTACDQTSPNGQRDTQPTPNEQKKYYSIEEIEKLLEEGNTAIVAYNLRASSYNESLLLIAEQNDILSSAIKEANEIITVDQIPFDAETKTNYAKAIEDAGQAITSVGEALPIFEEFCLPENIQPSDYEAFAISVKSQMENIANTVVPELEEIPDHTAVLDNLENTEKAYLNSVQSMKQITAPDKEFVIERLKQIDTIVGLAAVTEDHDPNKLLGKEGGYLSCLYFSDSRVDKTKLDIPAGKNNVIDIGTIGGGSIEVFATAEDANARNDYLATFDETTLDPGSHIVVGTLVIRISSKLTIAQQEELTEQIISALIGVLEA